MWIIYQHFLSMQVFVFYTAGYESISSTLAYTHSSHSNSEVDRANEDMQQIFDKCDGK